MITIASSGITLLTLLSAIPTPQLATEDSNNATEDLRNEKSYSDL
ncbi:hypothetical protein [Clostridium sp.]|nr:hypothetical protein [Clostridium sp.]